MNAKQYDVVYKACLTAHKAGVEICTQDYGVSTNNGGVMKAEDGCACALGCFLIGHQTTPFASVVQLVSELLETSQINIVSFTSGFDDVRYDDTYNQGWYDAGRKMHAQLQCEGLMT